MPAEIDLLAIEQGSITAPAGCGKTQLIADTLANYSGPKPILILTHTNAGAAALRLRLKKALIPNASYIVSTLDGFAIKLIRWFPNRSGHDPQILEIQNAANDYPAIRTAALGLILNGHIRDALKASYSRLIVDEYQDCNVVQHELVNGLANCLPTIVLGDPMQAIFGFRGNQLVNWNNQVVTTYPPIGALDTPWRWRNAGTEQLGQWLLNTRQLLLTGNSVDLSTAPPELNWIRVNANNADSMRRTAAQTQLAHGENTVLIIGDSRNVRGRHLLTSQTPGATAVEAVDYGDLVEFARNFDLRAVNSIEDIVGFASTYMTQVSPVRFLGRLEIIRNGRSRSEPSTAENAAIIYIGEPSIDHILNLLNALEAQPNARVYRPEIKHCFELALRNTLTNQTSLLEEVYIVRERQRHSSRPISRRAVGSTLLLKGLEADVAVILHPEEMNAANLYVAISRGAKRIVICSRSQIITPIN